MFVAISVTPSIISPIAGAVKALAVLKPFLIITTKQVARVLLLFIISAWIGTMALYIQSAGELYYQPFLKFATPGNPIQNPIDSKSRTRILILFLLMTYCLLQVAGIICNVYVFRYLLRRKYHASSDVRSRQSGEAIKKLLFINFGNIVYFIMTTSLVYSASALKNTNVYNLPKWRQLIIFAVLSVSPIIFSAYNPSVVLIIRSRNRRVKNRGTIEQQPTVHNTTNDLVLS